MPAEEARACTLVPEAHYSPILVAIQALRSLERDADIGATSLGERTITKTQPSRALDQDTRPPLRHVVGCRWGAIWHLSWPGAISNALWRGGAGAPVRRRGGERGAETRFEVFAVAPRTEQRLITAAQR